MNKLTKLLSVFVIAGAMVGAGAALSGCGHKHAYEDKWSNDATNHWHAATCGHDVKADEGAHEYDSDKDTDCNVCGYVRTVAPDVVNVTGVTLDKTTAELTVGGTETLKATVAPEGATDKSVSWTSSDEAVATVKDGVVTAVAAGTATITVTTTDGSKTATCAVTVKAPIEISVAFGFEKRSIAVGETSNMVVIVNTTGENKNVTWKSSDETVATVSDSGLVTAVKAGTATITVTTVEGQKTAECEITVKEALEYENVATSCDLTALWEKFGNKNKLTEPFVFGKFTFSTGVYFDSTGDITGNTVNNQKKDIYFNITGYGNENIIQFDAKGASAPNTPTFTLFNEKGEKVWEHQIQTVTKGITIENLPAGYYKLSSDAAARLGNISIMEKLEKAEASGITVKNPTLKMLAGRTLPSSDLEVTLDYENGRHDVITDFTVNTAGFDATNPGKQKVTVEYKPDGVGNPFTAEVEVLVYSIDSIELSDYSCANTRVTLPVQKIFKVGEAFNYNNVAVTATCSIEGVVEKEKFILTSSEYSVGAINTSDTGKRTVSFNANGKTANYDIYVVEVEGVETTKVTVDAKATEVTLDATSKVYTVMTVNQAMQLLKAVSAADDVEKVITVKNGEYKEKVEIDLPNVTLMGEGADASKNVLWYDLIAGFKDPSGTTAYSTDGSASVSVRASAYGFHAENIMFKNYWNTNELYKESTKLHGDTQAVAILIQSDMTTFKNCSFSSYHDTLYAMEGRHLFEECYIEGRTDYIFGATATSYFLKCTIKTIGAGDSKNGGYIVATKGSGEGGMKFGYIFNQCKLIGDENVTPGTVSLARGWDKGMTLAFINCDISEAYSIEAFGEKTLDDQGVAVKDDKNDRYTKMNAAPNAKQLFEYNNTGAGALTAEILAKADATTHIIPNMCTILTEEEAKVYNDLTAVFTKDNGTVKYSRAWDGVKKTIEPTTDFNFGEANMGTEYEKLTTTDENGIQLFDGAMTVYALNGAKFKTENSKNFLWLSDGCVIKMNIAGEMFIDPYGGEYGTADNINVYYIDGKAVAEIKATTASPIKNNLCVKVIKLDKGITPAHVHQFGDWTVAAEAIPTPTAKGEATRTCKDCEEATAYVEKIVLPELTVEKYSYAASDNAGKLIYTLKENEAISFEADALEGLHAHNYGAWTVTATLEAAGKATRTCTAASGTCDAAEQSVDIPALNDERYVITNNTATLEAKGTGTYTITIEGKEITFEAETAKLEVKRMTETTTWTYAGTDDPVGTEYVLFVGCGNQGGWTTYGKGGYVALNLPEGAVLEFTRSPYETCDKMKINGVEQTAAKNEKVTYTVKVPGYVVISADNICYFKSFTVTIDPAYRHTQHYFGAWDIKTAPTKDAEGSAERKCLVSECGLAGATETKVLPVLSEEKYTLKASETAGKSIYTLKEDTTISFEADTLEGLHAHNYGEWVVVASTFENEGTATKTCTNTPCPDEPIVIQLPKLDDERYVITNNTATLAAAGTGTYTITIGEGDDAAVITFQAETPKYVPTLIDKTTTIDIGKVDHAVEGKVEMYKGVGIDATSGKLRNNGGNVQLNPGTKLVLAVEEGAHISFEWYDANDAQYGNDANAQVVIENGIATVTIIADPNGVGGTSGVYLKSLTVTYALQTAAAGYYYEWNNSNGEGGYTISKGTFVDAPDHYLEFKACKANDDWLAYGGAGSYIKLKVAAGSTVKFQGSEWDKTDLMVNGVAVTADSNHVVTYVATGEGEVELTSPSGSSYLKSIYVVKTYSAGETAVLGDYVGTLQGSATIYKGVEIDATASGAKFRGNSGNCQLGVGTVFTLNIAAGTKVGIEWYDAASPNLGSDENATVTYENGKAVITIKASDGTVGGNAGNIYIKSIKVVAASAD